MYDLNDDKSTNVLITKTIYNRIFLFDIKLFSRMYVLLLHSKKKVFIFILTHLKYYVDSTNYPTTYQVSIFSTMIRE
jgi:hypothetical protein